MSDELNASVPAGRLTPAASLTAGFMAGSPILLGLVPFGLIYGLTAAETGLTLPQVCGMSLLVFAGSAQLVFVKLWSAKTAWLAAAITCLVVNLRLMMYSASLKPYLGPLSWPQKAAGAYCLTDESYALSLGRLMNPGLKPVAPFPYYIGAAMPTWLGWQLSGLSGYLAGSLLPPGIPFEFAVPLTFLALLLPLLISPAKLAAALTAGLAVMLARKLPHNLGLIAAVAVGALSGWVWDHWRGGRS